MQGIPEDLPVRGNPPFMRRHFGNIRRARMPFSTSPGPAALDAKIRDREGTIRQLLETLDAFRYVVAPSNRDEHGNYINPLDTHHAFRVHDMFHDASPLQVANFAQDITQNYLQLVYPVRGILSREIAATGLRFGRNKNIYGNTFDHKLVERLQDIDEEIKIFLTHGQRDDGSYPAQESPTLMHYIGMLMEDVPDRDEIIDIDTLN